MIKNYKNTKIMTSQMEGLADCPIHNEPHTRFPNSIMESIFSLNLSKNEIRSILFIARLTHGCHRLEAELRKVDFKLTGIPGSEIKSILDKLVKKNIIKMSQAENRRASISINLETKDWKDQKHIYWDKNSFSQLIGRHLNEENWN